MKGKEIIDTETGSVETVELRRVLVEEWKTESGTVTEDKKEDNTKTDNTETDTRDDEENGSNTDTNSGADDTAIDNGDTVYVLR